VILGLRFGFEIGLRGKEGKGVGGKRAVLGLREGGLGT
jgi:hypothetical protein